MYCVVLNQDIDAATTLLYEFVEAYCIQNMIPLHFNLVLTIAQLKRFGITSASMQNADSNQHIIDSLVHLV